MRFLNNRGELTLLTVAAFLVLMGTLNFVIRKKVDAATDEVRNKGCKEIYYDCKKLKCENEIQVSKNKCNLEKEKICQDSYNECLAREDKIEDPNYKDIADTLKKTQTEGAMHSMARVIELGKPDKRLQSYVDYSSSPVGGSGGCVLCSLANDRPKINAGFDKADLYKFPIYLRPLAREVFEFREPYNNPRNPAYNERKRREARRRFDNLSYGEKEEKCNNHTASYSDCRRWEEEKRDRARSPSYSGGWDGCISGGRCP